MALKYNDICINIRREMIKICDGNPSMTAQELVRAASGKTREQLLRDYSLYAPEEVAERAMELCRRRSSGEPLAYILGQWDFMGLTLEVCPGVLIPRDDTEIAAQLAIKAAQEAAAENGEAHVLDLCCGSGCIGLSVASRVKDSRVIMADISDEALTVSHRNAKRLGLSLRAISVRADALGEPLPYMERFDVMVCNPPYITGSEMKELDSSVKDFEPELALYGGTDGLDFYRAIVKNWLRVLNPGGSVIFEVGAGQAPDVIRLLAAEGCDIRGVARDSGKIDRAVVARVPQGEEEAPDTQQTPPEGGRME